MAQEFVQAQKHMGRHRECVGRWQQRSGDTEKQLPLVQKTVFRSSSVDWTDSTFEYTHLYKFIFPPQSYT